MSTDHQATVDKLRIIAEMGQAAETSGSTTRPAGAALRRATSYEQRDRTDEERTTCKWGTCRLFS